MINVLLIIVHFVNVHSVDNSACEVLFI